MYHWDCCRKPSTVVAGASQGKGLYELKDALHAEYNPFFYHYSRQEQTAAMDVQRARKKQQGLDQGQYTSSGSLHGTRTIAVIHSVSVDFTCHCGRSLTVVFCASTTGSART